MSTTLRTNSSNPDFISLVQQLDAYLAAIDGDEHAFYAPYNTIAALAHVIVLYEQKEPIACGAIKEMAPGVMEVKRMFTVPAARGKGAASEVLQALEDWAAELGCQKVVLETGRRMPDAVAFYKAKGYSTIPAYGQYIGVENSLCFQKLL